MSRSALAIGPDLSFAKTETRGRSLVFLTVLAAFLVWGGCRVLSWDRAFPDFICYWSAGKIVAAGASPYDVDWQTRIQHEYGWDKATDGFGVYDFLPFYYPPWFAWFWVVFLPLGYTGAKIAWFFVNVELTLLTGHLLTQTVRGVPRWLPLWLVPCFLFSLTAVLLAQTTTLVFFLMVLTWYLLEQRQDRAAGVALAWLTLKPQLTAVLLLGLLLWLIRQRRWAVLGAFGLTLSVLCLISTLLEPSWLFQMLQAPRVTPSPTEHYPWIGNTWFLLLRTVGLQGWGLNVLYLAIALPTVLAIVVMGWRPGYPLSRLFAAGTLAAFFVAPYARHYDFPILLIPLLVLVDGRLAKPAGVALLVGLLAIPYGQVVFLGQLRDASDPSGKFLFEATYFWVPLLLAVVCCLAASPRRARGPRSPGARG